MAKKYQAEQIITLLREAETGGETVEAFCRRNEISTVSFYRLSRLASQVWRSGGC